MKTLWAMVIVLCCAMFAGSLTGCTSAQAKAAETAIEKAKVPAFNGAVAAFMLIDDANSRYQDSVKEPTREQFAEMQKRTEFIEIAREGLSEVREWLSGKNANLDTRAKMQEIVQALDLALRAMKAGGLQLPKGVDEALSAARLVL